MLPDVLLVFILSFVDTINLMIQEECSFKNLKLLNLIPPPCGREPVDAFVAYYLRQDCPQAALETWPRVAKRPTHQAMARRGEYSPQCVPFFGSFGPVPPTISNMGSCDPVLLVPLSCNS
ncbi:hypothetical protein Tco_0084822 [Tanacetum coccineum]